MAVRAWGACLVTIARIITSQREAAITSKFNLEVGIDCIYSFRLLFRHLLIAPVSFKPISTKLSHTRTRRCPSETSLLNIDLLDHVGHSSKSSKVLARRNIIAPGAFHRRPIDEIIHLITPNFLLQPSNPPNMQPIHLAPVVFEVFIQVQLHDPRPRRHQSSEKIRVSLPIFEIAHFNETTHIHRLRQK